MEPAPPPFILLAEDDEDIRAVVSLALTERFRVAAAATGAETLALLAADRPDLLVFDWSLSDMSGDQLVARLRALGAGDIALVAMSGMSGLAAMAAKIGAVACPKPCTMDQLFAAIDKALGTGRTS